MHLAVVAILLQLTEDCEKGVAFKHLMKSCEIKDGGHEMMINFNNAQSHHQIY